MKNEVKALIGQLTAERTRIDVAILALKAMDGDDAAPAVVNVTPTRAARTIRKPRRKNLTDTERREIQASLTRGESLAAIATRFDMNQMGVYKIRSRMKASDNGATGNTAQPTDVTFSNVQ